VSKAQAEVIAELRLEVDRLKAQAAADYARCADYMIWAREGLANETLPPASGHIEAMIERLKAERRTIAERQREMTTQECVAVLSRSPFQMVREYTHGVGAAGRATPLVTEET